MSAGPVADRTVRPRTPPGGGIRLPADRRPVGVTRGIDNVE